MKGKGKGGKVCVGVGIMKVDIVWGEEYFGYMEWGRIEVGFEVVLVVVLWGGVEVEDGEEEDEVGDWVVEVWGMGGEDMEGLKEERGGEMGGVGDNVGVDEVGKGDGRGGERCG